MGERRHANRIDVGTYADKIGFTVHFEHGEKEHFLFSPTIARKLAETLLSVVKDVGYIERQMPTGDGIGLSEGIGMRLTPPREE